MNFHPGSITGRRATAVGIVRGPQLAPTLSPQMRDGVIAAFNDGRTYSEIAEEFSVARNVIAGTIFRARKRGEVQREKLPTRARRVSAAAVRKEPPKQDEFAPVIDYTPRRVSFFDLKAEDCRWPLWKSDVLISEKQFCGRPAKIGQSYCTHCLALSVAPHRSDSFDKQHGVFKFTKRGSRR
ncbi:hypothetical protein FHT98_0657 [Bosea sp. AK1]|uniref:GcrA family cell cycle regulator n=1 Tax=Bosea sp. AK1 TaxID=2587160 RepID=UPI001151FCBD|nr:GcrA family cell cycle regulator [Bosea sp. AK1]TQI72937.1 hypothetical protein FHT98_0657 [Bosea sp. AK1]